MTKIELVARKFVQGFWRFAFAFRSAGNRARLRLIAMRERFTAFPGESRNRLYRWMGKPLPMPLDHQRDQLVEFYQHFESLSDMICDAAHRGNGDPWQAEYEKNRAWMMRAYPAVRPYLIAHLSCDSSDDAFGMRVAQRPTDAFEALFCAESLNAILEADGGDLINRLDRARSALYRYADHLRDLMEN